MDISKPIWIVRAGSGGKHIDDFLSNGVAAIGWGEPGPLDARTTDEELERRFAEAYRDWKEGSRRSALGQVKRFLREPTEGDPVTTYDVDRRIYVLGTIHGPAGWRDQEGLQHRVRPVKWTHEVRRDALSATVRNSLGSTLTLFRLDPDATAELFGKATPIGTTAGDAPASAPLIAESDDTEAQFIGDVEQRAQEFVEDKIARLHWKEMQELVAAILRAMGYRTRVADDGPDRGVDIFASPDGLGLEEPRIFVEVKHRQGQMRSPAIRSFLGGRKPGDRCLYVSTGGFSKDARYEADRATVPIMLITLSEVRELFLSHYDKLDAEAKAMVPLRRVYLPVPQ